MGVISFSRRFSIFVGGGFTFYCASLRSYSDIRQVRWSSTFVLLHFTIQLSKPLKIQFTTIFWLTDNTIINIFLIIQWVTLENLSLIPPPFSIVIIPFPRRYGWQVSLESCTQILYSASKAVRRFMYWLILTSPNKHWEQWYKDIKQNICTSTI